MPFSYSRWASRESANHSSVNSRIVSASETRFEETGRIGTQKIGLSENLNRFATYREWTF